MKPSVLLRAFIEYVKRNFIVVLLIILFDQIIHDICNRDFISIDIIVTRNLALTFLPISILHRIHFTITIYKDNSAFNIINLYCIGNIRDALSIKYSNCLQT